MDELERTLESRGIKPTAMRLLILRTMKEMNCAVSVSDLENKLVTVDKSTIFRTLTLFLGHHLVHCIEDGSGQMKYAVCAEDCHCGEDIHVGLSGLHTHFYCERCQRTFCLRGLPIPEVNLPEGFHLHSANYILKGLCPDCQRNKPKCQ